MSKSAKLKDIAEALNVSIATVSRALNDKPDISQKTKDKVLELAKKMDYQPNNLAISLRKKSESNIVGVVLPDVSHFFFSSVLDGIMRQAHQKNHLVLVGETLHQQKKEKKIIEDFLYYGISGLLIVPAKESDYESILSPVLHRRIPTIVIDRIYDDYNGNYVRYDDVNGAILAVQHLIDQGYKKIAHIGSDDKRSVGLERRNGYTLALGQNNISINPDYLKIVNVNETEKSVESGYQACKEFFNLSNPPDGIFTVTDDVALGVYKYAKEHNINIPNQLGVVGFSDSIISKHLDPKLSTIHQDGKMIGEQSFNIYFQALQTDKAIFQKTFQSKLIIRESSLRIK